MQDPVTEIEEWETDGPIGAFHPENALISGRSVMSEGAGCGLPEM